MLRLFGQLRKNTVHLNSHKDAFCVLASFRVRFSKEAWQDQCYEIFGSVGGAYMNINEFPGHACGSENFSSCSLNLSRFNGIFYKGKYIYSVA